MNTTQYIANSEAVDNARQVIDIFVRTNPSHWSQPSSLRERVSRWFGRFAALMCCMEDDWLDMQTEARCRDDIRQEMMGHYGPRPGVSTAAPVTQVIEAAATRVFNDTGYDMMNFRGELVAMESQIARAGVAIAEARIVEMEDENMMAEPEDVVPVDRRVIMTEVITDHVNEYMHIYSADRGLRRDYARLPQHNTVRLIPHFTAQMVLVLRAKFGRLLLNDANRMLIEREYLRACREGSVRYVDIALHQQWVMNAYFNEGVLEELATTRPRVPKWLRNAFGSVPSAPAPVC